MQTASGHSSIVRIDDAKRFGINMIQIHGLQIFSVNEIEVPNAEDPRLIFLKRVTELLPSSAQLGWLALKDLLKTPEEAFGPSTPDNHYTFVRSSVYGGSFYVPEDMGSILFAHVKESFWEYRVLSRDPVEYSLRCDALAIYAGAHPGAADTLIRLANGTLLDEEQWLKEATGLYDLVIVSQDDGWYFEAYSQQNTSFSVLERPLQDAVASITSSLWYQENKAKLKWDEGLDNCLKIMP